MNMKHTTALATILILAGSLPADADMTKASASTDAVLSIKSLPTSGMVSVMGTVEDVDGDRQFTLRDKYGHTIDVQSQSNLKVSTGDKVMVKGQMNNGFLGIGREITIAKVQAADTMHAMGTPPAHAAAKGHAKMDMSGEWKGKEYQHIADLPDAGDVAIRGQVVAMRPGDQVFILRDTSGETVDVHTVSDVSLNRGDMVMVKGRVDNEIMGMGEEIWARTVVVTKDPAN